jgi:hypothetical protein
MRVSDGFNGGKWPQSIINIQSVAFLPMFFNQIAFLSATLAVYRHYKGQWTIQYPTIQVASETALMTYGSGSYYPL